MTETPLSTRAGLVGKVAPYATGQRGHYLVTEEAVPAPMGSSLEWLMQIDGDNHRNAFLNSPWVKAVIPIRPGHEKEAIQFLERQEVASTDGLDDPYPYDAKVDSQEYEGKTLKQVLLLIAEKIAKEYEASLEPVPVGDQTIKNPKMALPTEKVFSGDYDPLEGGIKFDKDGDGVFRVFSEWTEVLPTDQIVAAEYSLQSL